MALAIRVFETKITKLPLWQPPDTNNLQPCKQL